MKKIEAIIRVEKVTAVTAALAEAGFAGLNVVSVVGRGSERGIVRTGRTGAEVVIDMLPKTRLTLVVRDADIDRVCQVIKGAARTGEIGDGIIFISDVIEVMSVRTDEKGEAAL